MIDIKELKRLAEAASDAETIFDKRYRDFIAAANPAVVLELIARIDELESYKTKREHEDFVVNEFSAWYARICKEGDQCGGDES